MRLEDAKQVLKRVDELKFQLPDGSLVPSHFHVTEVGKVTKHFIDCGGVERIETVVNFQLWNANDYDHRLHPEKLVKIIELAQERLGIGDEIVEVEYQGETIGKFGLEYVDGAFHLTSKQTACLALDACNIPLSKVEVDLSSLTRSSCCSPDAGCC